MAVVETQVSNSRSPSPIRRRRLQLTQMEKMPMLDRGAHVERPLRGAPEIQDFPKKASDTSNTPREIRIEPHQHALLRTAVPQDPSGRVTWFLSEIARYLITSPRNLPSEARRLQQCVGLGDLLTGLDLLLHDHVLDSYLLRNPRCLDSVRLLFACRHHYLLRPDLMLEDGEESKKADEPRPHAQGDKVFVPQIRPLLDAFKSNNARPPQQVSWMLDFSLNPSKKNPAKTLTESVPAGIVKDCLDAYDNFEPVSAWTDWAQQYQHHREHVSLEELEVARKIYSLGQLVAPPPDDSLQRLVSAMPVEIRQMLYGMQGDRAIIEDLSDRIRMSEVFDRGRTDSSIELQLDFECPAPAADELPPKHAGVKHSGALSASSAMARSTPKGIATIEEYGRYHYKGSTIPLPQVLLPWAINFLADEDVDRTVGWTEKFAELTEYLAHLHYTFSLEDWGPQMKEAVDMLNTHRIFGNYYYGHPKLNLDFTVNAWPKESRRLPRLPGPDMELRRESDGQKELNGPRLLQHLDIVSAHDQQYEMPVDILKKCYLQPYLTDALAMWNAGLPAAHMDSINLAHHENKYYEAGMENGIVRLARFLNGDIGRFRYNPQDVTESEGSRVAKRASLLSFAMFRGAKRAAIQQCLNVFNGSENRKMCTPWRTLNLPAPQRKQKPDAGIIFSNHLIKDAPPERERRDPWAYTRAHRRYRKEEEAWAAWTREHTLKVAWKLKLSERGGGPVMELPKTWKGLYPPDVMDLEMKRRYELLRRCQIIRQGLKRAARRAPRPFISGLIEMVDAGSRGEELQGLDLRFAAHEFTPECAAELALIRPTEAAWLEYIYQPSRNRPTEPKEPIDSVGAILISRVKEMLRDVSPVSLFGDLKPKSMKEFLNGLNGACGGPIGRHRFTESEVRDLASTLHSMKILKVLRQRRGELQFARPETEFHPEILIVWPGSAKQKADAAEVGEDGRAADGKSVAASKSSHLTVPASIDDFMEYPEQMPRKKDVLSLEDYILNPTNNPEDQERTNNLFRCLAYRLGLSLRGLKAIRRQDIGIIRNPDLQIQNADFLGTMVSIWTKDTRTRPNNPRKNPRKVGTHRETLTAPDVVKMADPEHFREEWLVDEWPGEHQARGIVRRNLVRELSENKTMIWPVQLPYDRWTKEYAVPNPNPQISLPDEYVGKEKSVLRREPIWTFGHTSRKPRAHLFWDVNSWPLSALSRETRERVRRRGPKNQHDQRGQKQGSGGEERPSNSRPSKIRYWKKAEEKRVFVPGAQEFWLGDTPLQRKVIEQRFRERFERRKPKKRTWTERVADALFGQEEKPTSPEDFALPDVDPSSIPESRPAKRPRLNESFESVGSSQVPQCPIGPSSSFSSALNGGIPGGEKTLSSLDAGLTITGADNKVLRYEAPGSAKAMRLLEKLRVEKGRASVTYKIPEGGQDDDPPLIIYYKPEVIVEM